MKLQTPLDKHKDVARKVIAEGVAMGKKWEEIAAALTEMFGENVTPAMVRYFYYREFGSKLVDRETVDVDVEDFDMNKELIWLYKVQKKRIIRMIQLENETGIPFPEVSRNIEIASKILERLGRLGSGEEEDLIELVLDRIEGGSGEGGGEG